ncbi:MAG TPA: hypothetical protein VIY48_10885, partial [Candidatus Paceibacterota bacterium]
YNAIAPPGSQTIQNPGGQGTNNSTIGGTNAVDITATIMNALNPQGIIGTDGFKNVVGQQGNSAMYYLIVSSIVYIMTGVSLFMLAAVFIFAAMRFVMRVIGLWFIIIAAPAAFVAAIFRGKEGGVKWFNAWLGYLLEFAFYPAVFLFMFYIEIRFLQEMNNTALFNNLYNATANASAAGSQSWTMIAQAAASVSIRLGFIMATMYLILRASQWTGKAFNNTAIKWADKGFVSLGRNTLKLGGAGAARVSGLAYQQTIGRGAAAAAAGAERRGFGSSAIGYRLRQGLQGIARTGVGGARSFDQFKDVREKELAERTKMRERADRRGAVQDLYAANKDEKAAVVTQERVAIDQQIKERVEGQAATSALFSAARREATQANQSADDITRVKAGSVPTGTRRLAGGAPITNVAAGATNVPASTPFNVSAQRALDEIKQKAQKTAQAGAVSLTLATTPNMSKSSETRADQTRPASPLHESGEAKEEIKGLREAVSALRNSQIAQPVTVKVPTETAKPATIQNITYSTSQAKSSATHTNIDYDKMKQVVKKVVRKEFEHFGPAAPHEPTPPTPSAPATAAKPAPQAHNDDYPFGQAAE